MKLSSRTTPYILLTIIVAGNVFLLYINYVITVNVRIVECKFNTIDVTRWSDISGITVPRTLRIVIELTIHNPALFTLKLEDITYNVYIMSKQVVSGTKNSAAILPPGVNSLEIELYIELENITKELEALIRTITTQYCVCSPPLRHLEVDIEIRGEVEIPIKIYNIIEMPIKIKIPYFNRSTITLVKL